MIYYLLSLSCGYGGNGAPFAISRHTLRPKSNQPVINNNRKNNDNNRARALENIKANHISFENHK